jgi:hypothetical protein
MVAIRAHFDGEKIIVPEKLRGSPPGEVVVVFETGDGEEEDKTRWMNAKEGAFAKVWDNAEDAVYDAL